MHLLRDLYFMYKNPLGAVRSCREIYETIKKSRNYTMSKYSSTVSFPGIILIYTLLQVIKQCDEKQLEKLSKQNEKCMSFLTCILLYMRLKIR